MPKNKFQPAATAVMANGVSVVADEESGSITLVVSSVSHLNSAVSMSAKEAIALAEIMVNAATSLITEKKSHLKEVPLTDEH